MGLAKDVTDLEVYRLAFDLQQRVFDMTKKFPAEEKYSLTDQVRRSSRSVGANISEAWKKRRYPAHFVSKLTDADGEQSEACHWLRTAVACRYVATEQGAIIAGEYSHVSGMLNKMMQDSTRWCSRYTTG
jgi:four helix bundle protein